MSGTGAFNSDDFARRTSAAYYRKLYAQLTAERLEATFTAQDELFLKGIGITLKEAP